VLKQFVTSAALAANVLSAGATSAQPPATATQPAQATTTTDTPKPNDYTTATRGSAVRAARDRRLRDRSHDDELSPPTATDTRDVEGRSERAGRLLLRLPDDLHRFRREQRHDRRPAELNVIKQQFARLGSKCRPYAPLYRQVTLAGLQRLLAGGGGVDSLERGGQYDRCPRRVELLREERQQRPRLRPRRALAGILHPESIDP